VPAVRILGVRATSEAAARRFFAAVTAVARRSSSYVCSDGSGGGLYCSREGFFQALLRDDGPATAAADDFPVPADLDLPRGVHDVPSTRGLEPAGRLARRAAHSLLVTVGGRGLLDAYVRSGDWNPLEAALAAQIAADAAAPPYLRSLLALVAVSETRSARDTRAFRRNVARAYRGGCPWCSEWPSNVDPLGGAEKVET
jgi:hypothetical protein